MIWYDGRSNNGNQIQRTKAATKDVFNRNSLTEDDNHLTEGNHNRDTNRGQTQ
jgi:hypothetical protein